MKDIIYVANIRLPTEKAHGIQIMKTCEAVSRMAGAGANVELIVPRRNNPIKSDPFVFYSVDRIFTITQLPVIDSVHLGKIGFLIETISFTIAAIKSLKTKKRSVVYGRDYVTLFLISLFHPNVIWESHMGQWNFIVSSLIKRIKKLVVITHGLKDFYIKNAAQSDKISVLPDAVDIDDFAVTDSQEDCRRKYGLPDGDVAMYCGRLYDWKGAHILADAAIMVTEVNFVFVGGTDEEIVSFRSSYGKYKNIYILGRKPHSDIPCLLKSADILVLPNSRKNIISEFYTSPMKLFEYMASGVPIIASNISSIREVLTPSLATIVEPDDSALLASTIKDVLCNKGIAIEKANRALIEVNKYSWEKRAQNIIDILDK